MAETSTTQTTAALAETKATHSAPATLAELKAALPGARADFLLQCLENGWTVGQAVQAHMQALHAENLRLKSKMEEEGEDDDEDDDEEEDAAPKKKKAARSGKPCKSNGDDEPAEPRKGKTKNRRAPGVETTARRNQAADPHSEFDAEVMEMMSLTKCDRRRAVALVARKNPALHEEMLRGDGRNSSAAVQKLIGERFAMTVR